MEPEVPTHRILALDGGGLRAFFILEVLARAEGFVRKKLSRPDAVLAEYFHLFAGTSMGAIGGALLAWGLRARYSENPLTALRAFFVEKTAGKPRSEARGCRGAISP